MRADRLVATLLLMQARGRVTARELAAELEISVATARRDLEALSAAGIPVYPQTGRGGGWQLLGEGRTDLSGFTASEARALFLTLGPRAGESNDARSALRKIMRALPETFRADAEAAAESVIVEAGGWGSPAVRPPEVALLQAERMHRARARRSAPCRVVEAHGTALEHGRLQHCDAGRPHGRSAPPTRLDDDGFRGRLRLGAERLGQRAHHLAQGGPGGLALARARSSSRSGRARARARPPGPPCAR